MKTRDELVNLARSFLQQVPTQHPDSLAALERPDDPASYRLASGVVWHSDFDRTWFGTAPGPAAVPPSWCSATKRAHRMAIYACHPDLHRAGVLVRSELEFLARSPAVVRY
jgi:hypothetical protein